MRLHLINPDNPVVNITKLNDSYWNRYRVWKPLSLLVLAGLTSREWDVTVVDENMGAPDYAAMPRPDLVGITAFTSQATRAYPRIIRRVCGSLWRTRKPVSVLASLVSNLSYRSNEVVYREKRERVHLSRGETTDSNVPAPTCP